MWGYDYISDAATVSVHINRLREKLKTMPEILRLLKPCGVRVIA
ncbi:MAG: winged helix-turn-helix domain-containing protein [Anaerovoracaceae bacterium]